MSLTRFHLLGPLRADAAGVTLDLGPVRQQAVLAVLLLHCGQILTPDAILRAVWGEETPPSGTKLIPPYIYRLRRALPDGAGPVIDSPRIGYQLRLGSACVDLHDFDAALARAIAAEHAGDLAGAVRLLTAADEAWSGEPLAGLPGPFLESRRRQLIEQRVVGLERRLELELRLGLFHEAIPRLAALRAEHPFRERLANLQMIALYQTGRQSEALDVFDRLRMELGTALGVEPTPALTRAYVAMLRGDVSLPRPLLPLTAGRGAADDVSEELT
ncbi:MAG TPA: BTAD domain-containing putative transcriptional regulator [Phytomonospora sp.]